MSNRTYERTDTGNARAFQDAYGDTLRYVSTWKKWIIWDGKRWKIDDCNIVMGKAKQFVVAGLPKIAEKIEDFEERRKFFNHIAASQSTARIESMVRNASYDESANLAVAQLDSDPMLFNCQNGTIDCRTGELRPHDRADMITKLSPCSYDLNATAPTWIKFVGRIFQHSDGQTLIEFTQRAGGYCLTGDVGEQCLFILYGNGANGKSTFVNTLLHVMGDYGMSSQSGLLMSDYRKVSGTGGEDVAALLGVRAVSCIETREGKSFDEEKVKALTGGDKLRARRLYENSFGFMPTHKILLATNHKPTIRGNDWGIWRRINLIPFDATIGENEKDVRLADKLKSEANGILSWMVEGLKKWRANGLNAPTIVKNGVETYRAESDIYGQFLAAETEQSAKATVMASALYSAYQRWCKSMGIDYPMTHMEMSKRLHERGFEKLRTCEGVFYRGLSLLDDHALNAYNESQNGDDWTFRM